MQVVSLYTGILGLDAAAHAAGFTTVAACDSEPYCRDVIEHYLPNIPVYASDEEITSARLRADGVTGDITAVIGGPPCQDASIAGGRAGQGGNRWRWPEYLRIVGDIRPRWFVAENPPGILSVNDKRAFGRLLSEMESLGYAVAWATYGANAVQAPHQRKRVFIIGRLADAIQQGQPRGRLSSGLPPQKSVSPNGGLALAYAPKFVKRSPDDEAHSDTRGGEARSLFIIGSASCGRDTRYERKGQIKCRLGELFNGFPADLVTCPRWPSRPNEQQETWEPPRLIPGDPELAAKLKALGNAVVPAQAYPVFKAIADVELSRA